jgi:MarR family transcriptional repressor of emrRAB
MNSSFQHIEQAIDAIERRNPGSPRQEVLLNRLFCHIQSRLTCHWNEALRPHGLTDTLWIALLALYSHPEQALYPSDLSDTLDFSRTNATRVSDELVRHGWASRQSCCEDRRKIKLILTAEGLDFVERMIPISREYLINQWGDFSPADKDTLELLMRKLLTTLGG